MYGLLILLIAIFWVLGILTPTFPAIGGLFVLGQAAIVVAFGVIALRAWRRKRCSRLRVLPNQARIQAQDQGEGVNLLANVPRRCACGATGNLVLIATSNPSPRMYYICMACYRDINTSGREL
jgi:hypothetical protein